MIVSHFLVEIQLFYELYKNKYRVLKKMLYCQCQWIVTIRSDIPVNARLCARHFIYVSVVLFCSHPSNYATVVTQSGRCRRRPVVGMKTLCTAANYAAGMWQSWASSASWTAWTADGETSLGSVSHLTVWAWACWCQCSQLIGPAVSLYGYGKARSWMCSRWVSQAPPQTGVPYMCQPLKHYISFTYVNLMW